MSGLKSTLTLLAKTTNDAAVGVLIAALDSKEPAVRDGALTALLDRRSVAGQQAVLSRLHTAPPTWRAILEERRGRLAQAARDAVIGTDAQLGQNACQAIVWFREYELAPALVATLEHSGHPHAEQAARTLTELVSLLYEELAAPRDYGTRRDPHRVRRQVVSCLEQSIRRFARHKRIEVVEAFLQLVERENATLRQVLADPRDAAFASVIDLLTNSSRGGVLRLLLSFLEDPQPPAAILTVISRRSDCRFLNHLFERVAPPLTSLTTANLKRLEKLAWARSDQWGLIDRLDEALQANAVALLAASGLPRADLFHLLSHVASQAHRRGRQAAIEALAKFPGTEANQLVIAALSDEDPQVQAAALAQVRHRAVPGALPRLIEALDSPHECLRVAARDSLPEFTFARYLAAFDTLDDDVRYSTGELVRKIDPEAPKRLAVEMQSASRTRRLRGIAAAAATGLVPPLEELLVTCLSDDDDHLVRREAASALAAGTDRAVALALQHAAQFDRSVPVREAAQESIAQVLARLGVLDAMSGAKITAPPAAEVTTAFAPPPDFSDWPAGPPVTQ